MTRAGIVTLLLVTAWMTLGVEPRSAAAQASTRDAITRTRIAQHVSSGIELLGEAIGALGEPARASSIAYRAYVQFRAAHSDMEKHLRAQKYPTPEWEHAAPKLLRIRHDILQARTALRQASNERQLARAEAKLREALQLARAVQAMGA